MSRKEQAKKLGYICLILVLVVVILFSGLRILESTVLYKYQENDEITSSQTIERNGISYFPRRDITVILLMGIDKYGKVESSGSYDNSGRADMVTLLIFDEAKENLDILSLNRDTMMDIPELVLGGKYAGTTYGQLALSHTYGTGLEDSCENTRKTVSDFLYGLNIDYYIAMNMDAVSILNDAVGGVTVNVTEDFSTVDPTITQGELTLTGEQAIRYVQTRANVGDQLNLSRMERQKKYMQSFVEAFRHANQSEDFIVNTYEEVSEYIVTDLSTKSMSALLNRFSEYELDEVVSLAGENKLGDGNNGEQVYEFYPDEEALDELILRLFYAPKD